MTIEQLRIFIAIAEEKSIRKASSLMYMTPQALSKSMINLENELNIQLYSRTNTGIILTKEGEKVYEYAKNIISSVNELYAYFNINEKTERNNFTYSISILSCPVLYTYVGGILNTLLKEDPQAQIRDTQAARKQINHELIYTGKIKEDIILTNLVNNKFPLIHSKIKENYNCYFLYTDIPCLQVPKNSKLAEMDKIPLKMLENLPLLVFDMAPYQGESELFSIIANSGYKLKNVSYTANLNTCSINALNSNRYCFVGYPSVELRPLPNVKYIPLDVDYYSEALLFLRKEVQNKKIIKKFYYIFDQYFDMEKKF